MYNDLYNLLREHIFAGVQPSALAEYIVQFFTLFCVLCVVGIPFIITFYVVRRWL